MTRYESLTKRDLINILDKMITEHDYGKDCSVCPALEICNKKPVYTKYLKCRKRIKRWLEEEI